MISCTIVNMVGSEIAKSAKYPAAFARVMSRSMTGRDVPSVATLDERFVRSSDDTVCPRTRNGSRGDLSSRLNDRYSAARAMR
jgi:hypothetical protein